MKKLNVNAIRIDGGTQSRVSLDEQAVAEYVEALDALPPVIVFHDGTDHWLADGFHRLHAFRTAGRASIPADVRTGTRRDAILFSVGANGTHGLRRSNADKRKAVGVMLADAEWAQWSDRKIAEACGVSHPFVSGMRKPPEVVTVTTPTQPKGRDVVESDSTSAQPKGRDEVITVITQASAPTPAKQAVSALAPAPADDSQADELAHTVRELAQENETLRDRLAVEAMDASEDEKTQASETIAELRARVKTLEAENEALKVSRDTYMREASEVKKQVSYWRKQAEKAAKEAA